MFDLTCTQARQLRPRAIYADPKKAQKKPPAKSLAIPSSRVYNVYPVLNNEVLKNTSAPSSSTVNNNNNSSGASLLFLKEDDDDDELILNDVMLSSCGRRQLADDDDVASANVEVDQHDYPWTG